MTAWRTDTTLHWLALAVLLLTGCASTPVTRDAEPPGLPASVQRLNGTQWQLVQIQSMDDSVYRPVQTGAYTLAFGPQGRFGGQADCNRIGGGWAHTDKSQLVFSQIISTRALCPPDSLGDRYTRDLDAVRSFVKQDGNLFLATMMDGAILEFSPLPLTPSPAFNCAEADGTVETLVCNDAGLAELDLYLDELYQAGLVNFPEDELPTFRAMQRGWISGRNDCWKAGDMRACVVVEYLRRISDLEVKTGYLTVPAAINYACEGGTRIEAYFYRDAVMPLAVLNIDDEQVFAWQERAASGAHYVGGNTEFRIKGREVTLTTHYPNLSVRNCQFVSG